MHTIEADDLGPVPASKHYIIRGGEEGFDRLKILCRSMHAVTSRLFDVAGLKEGMRCLDVGCGNGDVSFELGRRVGPTGRVFGIDVDDVKLGLARRAAAAAETPWVEFRHADVTTLAVPEQVDFVYARFLLTHLPDPAAALANLARSLPPGGRIAVEDIDFSGCFCHPANASHSRYVELYRAAARSRGVDPDIGPRLPGLLAGAGFAEVGVDVVQPAAMTGELKTLAPLTMKAIGDAVVGAALASPAEVDRLVDDLWQMAAAPGTVIAFPRVVQAWGRLPG